MGSPSHLSYRACARKARTVKGGLATAVLCLIAAMCPGSLAQRRASLIGSAVAPLAQADVRLYGYATEQGGGPAVGLGVYVWDDSEAALGSHIATDATGFYSVTAPYRNRYHMLFTQWTDGDPYSYHKYFTIYRSAPRRCWRRS